ncbi:MAG: DUF4271 domain-containing protein [Bacteroidaceae bacterium]|nr:DUF4271 domain-containing protein [Bacteroidaceae bacterium]
MTLRNDTTSTQYSTPSTGDSVPEYWVTRVVRQMKGCSPAKIDSVIQANLPPRKIKWSQRPDTLEIPGLEGRIAYTVNLPNCYELGFFKGNALLHPELTVKPQGIPTEPASYTIQDSIISTTIILCLLLLSITVNRTHSFLSQQAHGFFLSPKHNNGHTDANITMGYGYVLLANTVLSATGGMLFMHYAQEQYNLFMCPFPSYLLLGVYTGIFALFVLAKKALSAFINWIFFDKTSRQEWRDSYNFLLIPEAAALLVLCAVATFLHLPQEAVLYSAILLIGIFKITLLYKTYTTFLFKIYGFLHLLSYLCALEIVPLLLLWVILTGVTEHLTITF